MTSVTIAIGSFLTLFGVIVTLQSDSSSITSLIPSMFGVIFLALGLLAKAKPDVAHHAMHGASVLALIGVLASVGSLVARGASGWALASQLVLIGACVVFLVLAIRSFRAARLARESAIST
ncbi:MAG: hypothetical protein HKN07_04335 [Acidimicrobiia bacterium]|nr:hypothetical protein [Acidimicrobiia bacterium]NNF63467.1 hypothetical protein [Acidimicrobiia bacterium]